MANIFDDSHMPADPADIAWEPRESPLLPVYAGVALLLFLATVRSFLSPGSDAGYFLALLTALMIWRTFRAWEAWRDLKKLQDFSNDGLL